MKVLFLDIDGVLVHPREVSNPEAKNIVWGNGETVPNDFTFEFCPDCVAQLNRIIEATGAKIVVSSAWRQIPGIEKVIAGFGVKGEIIGKTSWIMNVDRGYEIAAWIKDNGINPEDVVIIDDDADMEPLMSRLVKTSWRGGALTARKADEAIAMLGNSLATE